MTVPAPTRAPAAARGPLLACAAGAALATAGTWLRWSLEHTARIDTHSRAFVLASAVAGAGLIVLGVAALRVARDARALGWRTLALAAAAVQGLLLLALPLTSSDVYTNVALGTVALRGLSPYLRGATALGPSPLLDAVPQRWAADPSPYGPLFQPLARLAARCGEAIGAPLWGGVAAWKLLLGGATALALLLAARALRRREDGREIFALLALSPVLAWEVAGQAHNDGLLFLALVAFAVAAGSGRSAVATTALTLGVAVKYALAPLLGLYLLLEARGSVRRALGLGALALAVLAATFAPVLREVNLRAVLPMLGGEAARHAHSFTDLACLILDGLGWTAASRLAYRLLSTASALLCAALLLRAALRARSLGSLAHGYLQFLLALYLTAPWFQPWYLLWALPLLLLEPDPAWRRFLALFAVVTVVQWAAPLDPVTTVLGDAWAAWRIWRLARRPADAPASTGLAPG